MQCRKLGAELVLEEFIPLKKSCDEDGNKDVVRTKKDNKERMNWLSSVQLWNSDQHCSNIDFNNSKEISKTESIKSILMMLWLLWLVMALMMLLPWLHHMYELPLTEVLELLVSVLDCADAKQVSRNDPDFTWVKPIKSEKVQA